MKKLMAAVVASFCATGATAATFAYDLSNHPDGALVPAQYGLRLDSAPDDHRFFSFDASSTAQLFYDDVAGIARIVGTVEENDGAGTFEDVWSIGYEMTGVTNYGAVGNGYFSASGGVGFVERVSDGKRITFTGKQLPGVPIAFQFIGDGHRISGDTTTPVGRGWVMVDGAPMPGPGQDNDFLVIGTPAGSPGGGIPSVPVPAAGLLLLAGLGSLRVLKGRKA